MIHSEMLCFRNADPILFGIILIIYAITELGCFCVNCRPRLGFPRCDIHRLRPADWELRQFGRGLGIPEERNCVACHVVSSIYSINNTVETHVLRFT